MCLTPDNEGHSTPVTFPLERNTENYRNNEHTNENQELNQENGFLKTHQMFLDKYYELSKGFEWLVLEKGTKNKTSKLAETHCRNPKLSSIICL